MVDLDACSASINSNQLLSTLGSSCCALVESVDLSRGDLQQEVPEELEAAHLHEIGVTK